MTSLLMFARQGHVVTIHFLIAVEMAKDLTASKSDTSSVSVHLLFVQFFQPLSWQLMVCPWKISWPRKPPPLCHRSELYRMSFPGLMH